jgi:Flp pilus assembly protein TadG
MNRRFPDRTRPTRRRFRGQALVEFAFVAPIFFLLIFAMIDFGRYVYYVQVLNNAAREGARYAIVHGSNSFQPAGPSPDDPAVAAVVRNYAVGVTGTAALTINSVWGIPPNPPTNNRGSIVHVEVSYAFTSMIPIVPIPPITINGESTLVINN